MRVEEGRKESMVMEERRQVHRGEEGKQEISGRQVYVSAISSLEDFHILQVKNLDILRRIDVMLNPKALATVIEEEEEEDIEAMKEDVENVEKEVLAEVGVKVRRAKAGLLVSAPNPSNPATRGHRARATVLQRPCSSPDLVAVRFVDTGDTATVARTSLLHLPKCLATRPGLALNCRLFDCTAYGEGSRKAFTEMVMGHQFRLEVMFKDTKGPSQVDLCKELGGRYTSVRDTLVWGGHAKFLTFPQVFLANVEDRHYRPHPTLRRGKTYTVVVSHVSDATLWVQLLSRRARAATLALPLVMEEMAEVYGVVRSEEMWSLGTDRPGTLCAVRDPGDGLWYRAQVVKVVRGRILRVHYVDFGHTVITSLHKLRRLFEQFLWLPAIAQPATLQAEGRRLRRMAELVEMVEQQEVQLQVVGEEGQVELTMEGVSLNRWMEEKD